MSRKRGNLGRSLIRDQKKKGGLNKDGFLHTSDLPDGFDWARLNLRSVTEQSSVNDFLDQVKLAENEFNKEFSNVKIVTADEAAGLLSEEEKALVLQAQEEHRHILSIPRRPEWTAADTKEELDAKEREAFLKWRRKLALLREKNHISLTPYEMNIEVWRQLWRVIERSDVVVQIIDARNPLLFRCEDLEAYVKEIDQRKHNVLLLNKADFLGDKQREMWASHFEKEGVKIVFFSALQQGQLNEEVDEEDENTADTIKSNSDEEDDSDEEAVDAKPKNDVTNKVSTTEVNPITDDRLDKNCNNTVSEESSAQEVTSVKNSSEMLSRTELVNFLKTYKSTSSHDSGVTMVGMVGYPNVGKSSTINAVLSSKKVQVSATPGKTKHFQTLMVDSELCFCDCPGLVYPNFVSTKADMVINGILPVDQLTDYVAPVTLITNLIPRAVLEYTYSIMIPPPTEGKDPDSPPTADEFLSAYGYMRGFMTKRGLPDTARSARYILKDFTKGKLLYCYPPPDCDTEEFKNHSIRQLPGSTTHKSVKIPSNLKAPLKSSEIDRSFFNTASYQAHVKGKVHVSGYHNLSGVTQTDSSNPKPWKKHHNRNKKEKLRRIYSASET